MTLAEQIKQVMTHKPRTFNSNKYQHIIRQLTDIVKVQHEALEHAARWRPFGEAVARHIEGSECPVQQAIALSAPIVKGAE
jgi:hypothetical protein